jgi:deoxycytidine triphosphate deaminase
MHLASRDEIAQAIERDELAIHTRDGSSLEFLDDYRVGLRIERLYSVAGCANLARPEELQAEELVVEEAELAPNSLYLATTREVLKLGSNFVATIHTRSRFARAGLECLVSSNFVVPGFGNRAPTPLVLELLARLHTYGLSRDDLYFFTLLYRLERGSREENDKDYWNRFPLRNELEVTL